MKKVIFTLMLMLPLTTILAQDESEESNDYNWTVFTDATAFSYATNEDASVGLISLGALYNISEKFQAGASLSTVFGDLDGDAAISVHARYFALNNVYLQASLPVTDAAGEGFDIGIGNRFNLGDRVEFLPSLSYNTESEIIVIGTGFAIKL